MLYGLVFYLFATILVISAVAVISSKNPVHSVLFLILSFFNAAGLFIMLGAEFIGMILVIVYVGAVAVLFLFVVMMLDINFKDLRTGVMKYFPVGMAVGALLLFELITVYSAWSFSDSMNISGSNSINGEISNTENLGHLLYTKYFLIFQMSGLVLLVAMIGAIVLTLRKRTGVKKQKIYDQVNVKVSDVIEIQKVTPGTGI